jgi:hypothetical protein
MIKPSHIKVTIAQSKELIDKIKFDFIKLKVKYSQPNSEKNKKTQK